LAELYSPDVNKLPELDRLLKTVSECMGSGIREKLAVELVGRKQEGTN